MILIADSGSTKTTWSIAKQGKCIQSIQTPGINPYFQSEAEISSQLQKSLLPQLNLSAKEIRAVYFYGAGCAFDKIEVVSNALKNHFPVESIEVGSDLLGAARGICGNKAGIVCIMGTGSNSCFYDGSQIVKNVSPLGFILGDEGSGAVLGKLFIGDLLKDMLPESIKTKFFDQFGLTQAQIIDRVYRQPFPNRFLAGFSPFLSENIHEPAIHQLVLTSFISFFERNVKKYDYQHYSVNMIGSIAYHYKSVLTEAAVQTGIRLDRINQSPMEGLILYHTS